jgi:transposase
MTVQADSLPDDPGTLKAMLIAERTQNERLRQIIKELQRHRFGRRAETLPEDQMLLGLEDVEQLAASSQARIDAANPAERANRSARRRINRGSLPAHLPRIEVVVDIEDHACPCCGNALHRIGEDTGERLDMVQASAPSRLIEGGLPTEATVAQVLVSKYADHLPLYRQAQIYARQRINLDRSTLADWVGRAAFMLRPVHERLMAALKASPKLFADETTAPVLDPGRGRTKIGQLWAYARDDRPWGGTDPPGVAYVYAPDRKAKQPIAHLAGFVGILQVDGYGGYRALAERNNVQLAFCWSHVRRPFYELAAAGPAPIALLAAGQARLDQSKDKTRHGNPLCAHTLERPHPLPRRRLHRDRFQCCGAQHSTDCAKSKERIVRRLGWWRPALGSHRVADRDLLMPRSA